jgi:hypothetical protein
MAPPDGNDEGMTTAIERMLDHFIDRWLRWEQRRDARRMGQWKHQMYRDQRFGIW